MRLLGIELRTWLPKPFVMGATAYVISNDAPALVKFFAQVARQVGFNVGLCDGVADNVEMQAAIDALPAIGGSVCLLEGTYKPINRVNIAARSNITIFSERGATLKPDNGYKSLLTADVPAGQTWCVVADASGFSAGMGVWVTDDANKNTASCVRTITSVVGTTLNLDGALPALTVANNAFALFAFTYFRISETAPNYNENIHISGLCFDNSLETTMCTYTLPIITATRTHGGHVYGCEFKGGGQVAVNPSTFSEFTISKCLFTSIATSDGAIHLSGTVGTVVDQNIFIDITWRAIYFCSSVSLCIVSNNYFQGVQEGVYVSAGGTTSNNVICGNTFTGWRAGIYSVAPQTMIANNTVLSSTDIAGIRSTGGKSTIIGNTVNGTNSIGIGVGGARNIVIGNVVKNTTSHDGIYLWASAINCIISNNEIYDDIGGTFPNGIIALGTGCLITGNQISNSTVPINHGTNIAYTQYSDLFMDVLAASTNHCGSWAGTGAEQVIVAGITQPDVPRNLTITCTNVAAPSGNVVIAGVDAKGNTVSETFAIVAGGTRTGNVAFATITSITIPATVTAADTIDVGIGSNLGLSNVIYAAGDVYKVKKNNAHYPAASYTVSATYHTVDVSTGGAIVADDDFTIYYRSNLNIIG